MKNSETRSSGNNTYFDDEQSRSGLKSQALRGAGATVFSQMSMYVIQMFGTIVLARLLVPDDFGLVAMVTAFSYLLQNFGLRGFTEATIQSDVISHKKISTLFWIHMALSLLLTLFFVGLAPILAWFYHDPRLKGITVVIALSFVFNALSTHHLALLARKMQFYRIMGNEITAMVITTLIAIVMAWEGAGYWSLVARRVIPFVATAAGAWILCRWIPGLPSRGTGIRPMLKFGIHTYGNYATNYFSRNIDKILIGWRHGAYALGQYERAYYLFVMPVNQLSYPLTNVAVATLRRLRDDPEKFRSYYLKALSMIALVGMPLSAILTLTGRDLLMVLLGPQWVRAGEIFTVLGPAIGISLIYGTHGWLHLSMGRADRWFRWGIVEMAITTLAFIIGLPFGVVGMAIAYTLSLYVLIGPGLWYAGRPGSITLFSILSATWGYFVAALAAGLTSWFILYSFDFTSHIFVGLNIFVRILVSVICYTSFYLLLIVAFYQSIKPLSEFITLLLDIMPILKRSRISVT